MAKTHRMPYLCRSFSAKELCDSWALLWKMTCNFRHAMTLRHPVYPCVYVYINVSIYLLVDVVRPVCMVRVVVVYMSICACMCIY